MTENVSKGCLKRLIDKADWYNEPFADFYISNQTGKGGKLVCLVEDCPFETPNVIDGKTGKLIATGETKTGLCEQK